MTRGLILYVIGGQIGKVLKLDTTTLRKSKGRFARICVQLDPNKPLQRSVLVNGKEKLIEYEGLHLICFHCERYGHHADHCQTSWGREAKPGE